MKIIIRTLEAGKNMADGNRMVCDRKDGCFVEASRPVPNWNGIAMVPNEIQTVGGSTKIKFVRNHFKSQKVSNQIVNPHIGRKATEDITTRVVFGISGE